MAGVAVNVTLVPEHIAPEGLAAMLTLAAGIATVMDTVLEVTVGLPERQTALDVITQSTASPFVQEAFVYVALFVPAFPPLSFH